MYLEGITVCVGYADLLAAILPNNLGHLDHLVVVTDTKDYKTKHLCDFYNANFKITCVQTDAFYENGAKFNKGAGVNAGLAVMRFGDWVVHFDSDIWFPPHLRSILNKKDMEYHTLYGIDREMCTSYKDWAHYLLEPAPSNERYYLTHPTGRFALGSRVVHYNCGAGYFPIGYFQLWHPRSTGITSYPADSDGADRTDVLFAHQFDAKHRQLLPETFVIHLDSESVSKGANWWGRKTPPFMPVELCPQSDQPVPVELAGAVMQDGVFKEPTQPAAIVIVPIAKALSAKDMLSYGQSAEPEQPTTSPSQARVTSRLAIVACASIVALIFTLGYCMAHYPS